MHEEIEKDKCIFMESPPLWPMGGGDGHGGPQGPWWEQANPFVTPYYRSPPLPQPPPPPPPPPPPITAPPPRIHLVNPEKERHSEAL
jgi:hypothetical protein